TTVKDLLKKHSKETLKHLWGNITAYMQFHDVRASSLSPPPCCRQAKQKTPSFMKIRITV
ncbi:MAG: hypothetical protein LBG45_09445, partial [Dysgonamonadaceae bacterium]|nr:hypothetical protein [Dysgonamonadaceae bacterium]